jgi:hypothetical protein
LTDAFLQELIFSLCDTDIFVVNQVTLADQIFLTALQKRLQRDYPHQKVRVSSHLNLLSRHLNQAADTLTCECGW